MDPADDAYRLTLELLDRCELGQDPRALALAHLGSAVMLFGECDPEMAEGLLTVIERPAS